jgi:hypothetical protein
LKILNEIGHERVASKFVKDYTEYNTWDFFFYCMIEDKQYFIKHALRENYFDVDFMSKKGAIGWIIDELRIGTNIIYNLNLLLFTDFRKWSIP